MKPPIVSQAAVAHDWIDNLDDATLRSGHVVLSDTRIADFDEYMDLQLWRLEAAFQQYCTHHSVRKSFGR